MVDGKWAYLLVMHDSQADFIDSCKIHDKQYVLSGQLPFAEEMLGEVVIENFPRTISQLRLIPGCSIIADFDPESTDIYPKVSGSTASEEIYNYGQFIKAIFRNHIKPLTAQLQNLPEDDVHRHALQDSINGYQRLILAETRSLFDHTDSGLNAITAYFSLQYDLPKDTLNLLLDDLKLRFPGSINLTMVTGDSVAPASLRSKHVLNRRASLMGDVPPFMEVIKNETTSNMQDNEGGNESELLTHSSTLEDITTYSIGDTIEEIVLPGIDGQPMSIFTRPTPYILIDFWASWCKPCREEIPELLNTAQKYSDLLTVYAVSIDENVNNWKQAIDADGSNILTHVILRSDNPNQNQFIQRFGIKTIPHNFLLDKDRKIIAIDLRGKDLKQKIETLIGEK